MDAKTYLDEYQEIVGARIKLARRTANVSTKELCKRADLTKSRLLNWECGIRSPKLEMIPLIAEAIGCSPAYLAGFSDNMNDTATEFDYLVPKNLSRQALSNETEDVAVKNVTLRKLGFSERDISSVTVFDNTLSPTFSEGDIVLINKADIQPKNGFYAIRDNSGRVWIRGLREEVNGTFTIYTLDELHHPSKNFTESELKNLSIIGRVISRFNWI